MGLTAVEVDARGDISPKELSATGLRQVRKMLTDLELRVVAVGFRTRHGYNVAEGLELRVDATKAALQFAHDLGASLVVNQVGRVPAGTDGPGFRLLVEALTDLGNYGQHVGAQLAAETGSESGAELDRLLVALPAGATCVALNPGNLVMNGFPPLDALAALGSKVAYAYIKDGVQDRASGRGVEVQVGRGSVDFPALLGALEEHGYRGPLCLETERSEEPRADLSRAAEYLKSLF
jgi:sugar phosphate isomerase/epimerase